MRTERLRTLEPAHPPRQPPGPAIVAVGNFDGVHLGHQRALALARREAASCAAEFVAVTFDPHPARLLRPDRAPKTMTSLPLKAERLAAAGVERLVVVEFSETIARASPAEFVERLLCGRLGAAAVVQGGNFRFGRGRSGDLETLAALGSRHGFRVLEAPPVAWGGEIVSSTRIRSALSAGDLDLATTLLGSPYEIEGTVVSGAGRGRGLGFPTANLAPEGDWLLPHGVYAADALTPSSPARPFRAVVHYGPRPTFGDSPSLEAHLVGFSGNISRLRLRFLAFLRGIRTFAGPEPLCRQLELDVAQARDPIAFPPGEPSNAEVVLAGG